MSAAMVLQRADWRALVGRPLSSTERHERIIAQHRRALGNDGHLRNPQRWAGTQIVLGDMLTKRGIETRDPVPVEAVIAAHRAALSVLSPDEDWMRRRRRGRILNLLSMFTPRGARTTRWAHAQHGLGFALGFLGSITDRLSLFDEANAAYRAALTVFIRERDPVNWANSRNSVAVTLSCLASKGRPGAGDEAVAIYHELLAFQPKGNTSPAADKTLFNYGTTLIAKSELGDGPAALGEATKVFRQIAGRAPRDKMPELWALIRCALGDTLRRLGQQTDDADALEEALAIQRAELRSKAPTASQAERAGTIDEISAALRELGRMRDDPALLREAASCFHTALEGLSPEGQPLNWAEVQNNLASTLALLSRCEGETDLLTDAETAVRKALDIRTQDRFPFLWAISTDTLGTVLLARARSEQRPELAAEAIAAHSAAIGIFDHIDARYRLRLAQTHLNEAETAAPVLR